MEANYLDTGKWFPGTITRERLDGTFDVLYDDNDREQSVPASRIRMKNDVSSSRATNNIYYNPEEEVMCTATATAASNNDDYFAGFNARIRPIDKNGNIKR